MKILVHDYAGHPFQVHLSRNLALRGHEVTHSYFAEDPGPKGVLSGRPGDPTSLRFAAISIGRPYDKASLLSRRVNDLAYGRAAARVISELHPDVIISGNTPTEAQAALIRAARSMRAGFVYWMQDFYSVAASSLLRRRLGFAGDLIGAYYRGLERQQLRRSDAVVIITEDFRPLAAAWAGGDGKVHTIENWAVLDDFPLQPKQNDWSRQHALDDRFVYLYAGTLGRRSNPELLVNLARQCGQNEVVVVVGQGVGMPHLQAAKARHGLGSLRLLPLQPAERLPQVLATADVLVGLLEADAGSFSVPSKILSYLCVGRAILLAAPAENLAARMVAREQAGLVVAAGDQAGFIAAAMRLRDEPNWRRQLGDNGRAYAARRFDIGSVTTAFEAVLRSARSRAAGEITP
jgi:colanic acid biosynthesis glycosyl transferase WcaI